MKIVVAGKTKEVSEATTVAQLIRQEQVEMPEYVTVSINEEFINREDFDFHVIQEADNVEFLYFMGGGQ